MADTALAIGSGATAFGKGGALNHEPIGERVSALEEWVKGHEALCAERYGDLRDNMRWLIRGVFGMLIGITAWLGVQLWTGQTARVSALERPDATAVVVQPAK